MLNKSRRLGIIFFALLLGFFATPIGEVAEEKVYYIPLEGAIDPGQANYIGRAMPDSSPGDEPVVILAIDTPGGMIESAEKIASIMRNYPGDIYAYVRGNALSAGAYIALSADAFFMEPQSVIGAAEPVLLGSSEPVDEKNISAWVGKMRSAAEAQGKDARIAEAMVRSELQIDGLVDKGELLTLTTREAEEVGFSDGTVANRAELLASLGLEGVTVVEKSPSFWERITGWATSPTIATLLLTVGIAGLLIELFTAGFGVAGALGLIAFSTYFGSHMLAGMAGYESIFFFLLGIVLMLVEAFIPGFGIFGVAGLVSMGASIVTAAASAALGFQMLAISFIIAIIALFIAFRYLDKRGWLRRLILSDEEKKELGYHSFKDYSWLKEKEGITVTPLRPAGTAEIEEERFDVVSEGGFIDSNTKVKVVKVEGSRVVVRKV